MYFTSKENTETKCFGETLKIPLLEKKTASKLLDYE